VPCVTLTFFYTSSFDLSFINRNFVKSKNLPSMLKKISVFLVVLFAFAEAGATHLLGGIMTYRYLGRTGPNQDQARYEITITVYRDCLNGQADYDDPLRMGIYDDTRNIVSVEELSLLQRTKVNPPNGGVNCNFSANVCIEQGIYRKQVVLDASKGFHLWYQRCCRNFQNNLSDDYGQSYYCYIPPATQTQDNSPVILGVPAPYVCVGDTVTYSNAATDADGDSLVYSLEQPWTGADKNSPAPNPPSFITLPIPLAGYKSGYSFSQPFGSGGILTINSQTGLTTLLAPILGQFSFAVVVKQYRKINGVWVYLSEIRRDLQLIAINCTPNKKPTVSAGTPNGKGGYDYTVESGDKICFNISYTDPDYDTNPNGQKQMSLSYVGDILKGTNGYTGPLGTMTQKVSSAANLVYEFCWQTTCQPTSQVRNYPYSFTVTVTDSGCPPKSISNDFNILVTPYIANNAIAGNTVPCEKNIYTYTASSRKGVTYNWVVTGPHSIISGQGTNTLRVLWTGPGTGTITVNDTTASGCIGTPVTIPVTIYPTPVINYSIVGDSVVCETKSSNYTLSSTPPGSTFNWIITGGTQISGGTGGTIGVRWGTAGQGRIRLVEVSSHGCGSDTLTYNVRIANAVIDTIMGPRSVCPNITFVEYKTNFIAGATYQWFVTGGYQSGGGNSNIITINWGDVGTGTVKVVATSIEGCVSDTVYATVIKNHVILGFTPIGDSVVCEFEQNKTYSVVYTRRSLYTWTVTGGTNLNPGTTAPTITVNWGSAGIGTVTCLETSFDSINNLPCNGIPATLNVRISPIPNADRINGDKFVCQDIDDTVAYSVNGYTQSRYIWWKDADSSNISGQGTGVVKFVWNMPGVYKLTVLEISKDSCIGNFIDTFITVHPKPTTSVIAGDSVVCYPNHQNKTYSVKGFANSTYYWAVVNGTIQSGGSTNTIIVDWNDDHNCQLRVIEESEFGCFGDTQRLNVFVDHPLIVIKSVGDEYNNEKNIILQWKLINAPRYNSNFEIWRRTASGTTAFGFVDSVPRTDSVYIQKYQNTNETAYDYFVRIHNLCGDPVTAPFHRNILLTGNKANDDNYAVVLNWNRYVGWNNVKRYELYRRMGEDGTWQLYDIYNDTSAFYKNGFDSYYQCYRIKAIEDVGGYEQESWSNEICFGFDPIVWIPNAFTPDGNGLNDLYEIFTASIKEFHILIYDRWGEKIFESTDPKISWDGTFKGKTCQMDAYIYMIQYKGFDNKRVIRNGTVTLLR
jgi:gliding motility-associated-like protein